MSCLYVNESGAVISVDGGYFCVTQKNGLVRKMPKELLESITLFGNSAITTPCIQECLRRGVQVHYFSGKGAYYGKLISTRQVNGARLREQILAFEDREFCLALAKKIAAAKIRNQIVLLRRYQRGREELVSENILGMKQMEGRAARSVNDEELMGVEGAAARLYFAGLGRLVRQEFAFSGRNRQPPRDAFNAMLSLGYTLLLYEIYAEIEGRGMTPYIGFYHKIRAGHPCLASDLMEEWRAMVVDAVTMSLVQGGEISPQQFEPDDETGGVLLRPDGMKIFIRKLERKFQSTVHYLGGVDSSVRRCFYLQTAALAKAVEERDPSFYQPILLR